MVIERQYADGVISKEQMQEAVAEFFRRRRYSGKSVLVIVPDNTRSGPVGMVFKAIFDCIGNDAKKLDVLVALGTHPPISEEQICARLSMTQEERNG